MKLMQILNEVDTQSYTSKVKKWFKDNGLDLKYDKNTFRVYKDGKLILDKKTNSFFRSAHLDSFIRQTSKKLGIPDNFTVKSPATTKTPNRASWNAEPGLVELHADILELFDGTRELLGDFEGNGDVINADKIAEVQSKLLEIINIIKRK